MRRALILSAACLLAPLLPGRAPGAASRDYPVRTACLLRDGQVDTTSVESIMAGIIKPGMDDRQKAFAVYDFVRKHLYHNPPAREGRRAGDFEYGVVYDAVKLINVYGYGYCFQNRAVLEALWQAAGLDARSCGIGGHSIAEVFYDDQFHFFDADQQGYCLLPDANTVASIDQICRDPVGLILRQKNPSSPFFPATANPRVPYESKVILAAYFASKEDNYYAHDKGVTGHRMSLTLLPGMRLVRRFKGDGRWNLRNSTLDMEYKVGYLDPRAGPRDFLSDTSYANGELLYQPDLTRPTGEYRAGVWQDENIRVTGKGLEPALPRLPTWCVFRIRLPYVIVGWPRSFKGPADPLGAAVVSAVFHRGAETVTQKIGVSTDGGLTWTDVWQNAEKGRSRALVDLSRHVVPKYEYLVRFELGAARPAESRLESVAIRTAFQLAPRCLPALTEGENAMRFSLGEQTEVLEIRPNLSDADDFVRHFQSYRGVWLENGRLCSKRQQPGEVICRLRPPAPGTVHRVGVTLGCRREPYKLTPQDDIRIYFAEDRPRKWKCIYDDKCPPYMKHWSYRANAEGVCRPGTREAYVKIAITTVSSAAVQDVRLRMDWKPDGPSGLPPRGIRVEHGWSEAGRQRVLARVLKTAPARYTVRTGKDVVNAFVAMEPVRDPDLHWRPADPPFQRPPPPSDRVLDEGMRDEMRTLLRAIDADPETGVPRAAKSGIGWLSGGAKQARAILKQIPAK